MHSNCHCQENAYHFISCIPWGKKSLRERVDFIERAKKILANMSMPFYITESWTLFMMLYGNIITMGNSA